MNWHDVLDKQIDLYRWWATPHAIRFGEAFAESVHGKNDTLPFTGVGWAGQDKLQETGEFAQIQRDILFVAEPVYVSDEVMDVFEATRYSFKVEKLIPEDLLTPAGFMYFDRSYTVIDAAGKRVSTRAMSWAPMLSEDAKRSGIFLSFYTDTDERNDDYNGQFTEEETRTLYGFNKLAIHHFAPWWFHTAPPEKLDETYISKYYADHDPEVLQEAQLGGMREFQVLMRLASQRLASAAKEQPPRAYGKRAEREGFKPYVTVITLRRPKRPSENGEPSPVNWTHRWIVGMHWRSQWYPSLNEHRQILIGAYVKGPEDKELIVRHKRAFNFIR